MSDENGVWLEDVESAFNKWRDTTFDNVTRLSEFLVATAKAYQQTLAYILCNDVKVLDGGFIIDKEELEKFAYTVVFEDLGDSIKVRAYKKGIPSD